MEIMNSVTKEKLDKTIERMQKALAYNDEEYMRELVRDLAEFAYFAGFKEAQYVRPVKKPKKPNFTPPPAPKDAVETQISELLHSLGIPLHIKGHKYLIDAINLTTKDPSLNSKPTKELYSLTAKKYNTTISRVERAIRHAIKTGWSRGNPETISMILGGAPITETTIEPTNSEFIHRLSDYMRDHEITETANDLTEEQKMNHGEPIDGAYLKLVQMSKES